MNLEQMRQEVIDRGYDYIDSTRITGFLQRAYKQICSREEWPFLEKVAVGTAPLEVPDVTKVLSVQDVAGEELLPGATSNYLLNYFGSTSGAGTPAFWWMDNLTIKLYPEAPRTISVRYLRVPGDLADTDVPLIPARWTYLIVNLAIVECLRDDDEYEEARALKNDVAEDIKQMTNQLMNRDLQGPRVILRTGRPGDYL